MPHILMCRCLLSILFVSLWYQTLAAQTTEAPEQSSTPPPPLAIDVSNKIKNVEPKKIQIELPSDPATVGSLRKIADAIAAATESVQIHEAGTVAENPMQIEAELRVNPTTPTEVVKKIIASLAELNIARIRFVQPSDGQNMVIITVPADTTWNIVRRLQTKLASLEGFKFDVRVRNNSEQPTSTSASSEQPTPEFPPEELQSQITQLEVELAVQKLQFGTDHPNVKIKEKRLETLRNMERVESQLPVTVFKLKNAKSSQLAEKIRLTLPKDAGPIVSDDRTNSVMIRGDEKLIKEIHRLIDLLDDEVLSKNEDEKIEPPRFPDDLKNAVPQQEIKVFTLQHIAAIEAQRILADLFGKDLAAITADQRVNSLVVRSQAERMAEIEAILKRLDEKPAEIVKQPASDKVQTNGISGPHSNSSGKNSNDFGSPIEAFRRRLSDLEKPVLELAEKLRSSEATPGKDHRDSVKLRADLRALVQQSFVARQEIQRAELVEFSRRLQLIQQTIEARDRISEKIVDRRMEELLDPNVEWTQPKSKTPSE